MFSHREHNLQVDLMVRAIDTTGVVDRVGIDPAAVAGELNSSELTHPQVAAFGEHLASQLIGADSDAVVTPVADLDVGLGGGLHIGTNATVPQQIDGGSKHRSDKFVGRQPGHILIEPKCVSHLW